MKFLIVDDHALIRESMGSLIREAAPDARVFEAAGRAQADEVIHAHGPLDFVLLDLELPDADGMDLLAQWRASCPSMAVAVLSAQRDFVRVRDALALGACGYLPKADTRGVMLQALRLMLEGAIYVPHNLLVEARIRRVPQEAPQQPEEPLTPMPALTPRQRDVARLLIRGMSNKMIARSLNLSETTVKNHVSALLGVLGVSTRLQVSLLIRENGWKP